MSAPVLELAGDENFPVARGARFLVAARGGDGKANEENRQRGKAIRFMARGYYTSPAPPKVFCGKTELCL